MGREFARAVKMMNAMNCLGALFSRMNQIGNTK